MRQQFSSIDFFCQQIVGAHYNDNQTSFEEIVAKLRVPQKDIEAVKTKLSNNDDLRITRHRCSFRSHAKVSATDKKYFKQDPTKNYYKYYERSGIGTDYEFIRVEEFNSDASPPTDTLECRYELIGASRAKAQARL